MEPSEYGKHLYNWFAGKLVNPPPLISIRAHGPNLRESGEAAKLHTFASIHPHTRNYLVIGEPETSRLHITPDVQRSVISNFVVPPDEDAYQRAQIANAGMPRIVTDDMLVEIARSSATPAELPIGFFAFGHTVVSCKMVVFLCAILYVPYKKVLNEIRETMPPVGT